MAKIAWPLRTRIEVEYHDSCTNGKWAPLATHRADSHPSLCRSIGYLVEQTKQHITVAQSVSSDTGNVADTMSIPRSCVRRVKRLKGLS